jgi:putative transposase
MTCPHCASTATTERPDRTEVGYRRFRCRDCRRGFNERTGTPFNRLQYPTDVVCLVVLWRFRYKLSLRDLAEMFLQRGITVTHEAVREWESKFAPLLSEALRKRRHRAVGKRWVTHHFRPTRHSYALFALHHQNGPRAEWHEVKPETGSTSRRY